MLTPQQIHDQVVNGSLEKVTAFELLKQIIENESDNVNRIRSVKFLGQLGVTNDDAYIFLENLIISDSNIRVRSAAIKVMFFNFLTRCIKPLKWIVEHETDILLLYTILTLQERSYNQNHEKLRKLLTDKLEEKYGVAQEDAISLLKIEYICEYGRENEQVDFQYSKHERYVTEISLNFLGSEDFKHIYPNLVTMKELTKLNISSEQKNEVLGGIGKLKGLKRLAINYTPFLSDISEIEDLDKLENLINLRISDTRISEIRGLDTLINLKVLNLEFNQITEIKGLDKLVNLEELYLGGNHIAEIKGLDNLTKLRKLYFSPIEDREYIGLITEIKGLDSLVSLEELDLASNKITEIKGLEKLVNLKKIFLNYNKIKEIKGLTHLTNLEYVDLSWNEITKINGIEQIPCFKNIALHCNKITDKKGLHSFDRPYFIDSHFKFPKINFIKKKGNEKNRK